MNQLRISQSASQLCRVILKLCICWCLQLFFLERKVMTNLDNILKSRDNFTNKGQYSQSYGFSRSWVWMWELDHKESWAPKNWCFRTVVLEKTLESPLECKKIKPVNPKGNQPCIFMEGLILKLKLQYFGHLMTHY